MEIEQTLLSAIPKLYTKNEELTGNPLGNLFDNDV
uniref:Uncharacterized protein n=1 Tax=Phage sp. ctrsQ3 TaxID=2826752 RepID=A0A8S5MFX6_9VIRU|nr:MAG TPA: hypothetical protein [Phage sp. ctrsQ3]